MRVMARDIELLQAVVRYRFLHSQQICWLFPAGSPLNLRVRLRKLYHHGYLDRVQMPTMALNDPFIYVMTERGALLIAEYGQVERSTVKWQRHLNEVEPSHIKHRLAINHVLISFRTALEQAKQAGQLADYRVYRADPKKHRMVVQRRDTHGHLQDHSAIPDAILMIRATTGEHGIYFVEVDRGTMGLTRWQEKITTYLEYIASSLLERDWNSRWAILLTVTSSERRLVSLAERTAAIGGRRGCWFTTAAQLIPETALSPLWVRVPELFQRRNEQVEVVGNVKTARRFALLDAIAE
jgi:hypothetical protein